jgi:hypothetical protein
MSVVPQPKEITMRTLIKVTIPVEAGNRTIKDGSLPRVVQATLEKLRPEAAYFFTEGGKRTCLMVADLKDPSSIPEIGEPFFMALDAQVEFVPVMNAQELQAGLARALQG